MKHASATPGTVDLSTCPSLPTMGSDVACCVDGECFRTGLPSPPQGVLASWSQLTPGGGFSRAEPVVAACQKLVFQRVRLGKVMWCSCLGTSMHGHADAHPCVRGL